MKKSSIKILLDIVMTVLFILLMDIVATGLLWHEILGLGICVLFTVHKLLNGEWIRQITLRFFDKKLKAQTKVLYILDWLVFFGMLGTVVSGILMSAYIFPFLRVSDLLFMSELHASFSYGTLILLSVHIGFHWKSILVTFRKMLHVPAVGKMGTVLLRITAAVLVLLGIKSSVQHSLVGKIAQPFVKESTQDPENYDETQAETYLSVNSSKKEQTFVSTEVEASPTLEEYLGSMFCTGCHKHCSLLAPACAIGSGQATTAEQAYAALYTDNQATAQPMATQQPAATSTPVLTPAPTAGQEENTVSATDAQAQPTLEQYLGSLFCDGCSRHCSLLAPGCAIGSQKAQEETETYAQMIAEDTTQAPTTTAENTTDTPQTGDSAVLKRVLTPFGDYIPIMSLFIGGTHYTIRLTDKGKKKKTSAEDVSEN